MFFSALHNTLNLFSSTIMTNQQSHNHTSSVRTRHVILPKELAKTLPKTRLLTENEWRSIGVQQSRGWEHYAIHRPEPHILLFRRPLGTDPQTGAVNPELKRLALEEYKGQFGLRGN
jgi:cyclin-dependent kinase regulatory subunit CKS1|eukprot:scaffold2518_cov272-Alexandrium_tamarense.AAC.2